MAGLGKGFVQVSYSFDMCDLCDNESKKEANKEEYLIPDVNTNVALVTAGAKMVKSCLKDAMLQGNFTDYDGRTGYSSHDIYNQDENDPGLVIKLGSPFLLNRIILLLWDSDGRSYSYYVEVSLNGKGWTRIADHTKHICRSWQYITFSDMVIRYIRIVGTHNSVNHTFHVVGIKAFRSTEEVKLERKWEPILGTLVPKTNVATVLRGARVIAGRQPEVLLNGQTTGYTGTAGFTHHEIGCGGICVQLSQPYILSSMKLLLWDGDARQYHYIIEVSTDNSTWTAICNRSEARSWQTVLFDPMPAVFIRLLGLGNTENNGFHVVHFECPASTEPKDSK